MNIKSEGPSLGGWYTDIEVRSFSTRFLIINLILFLKELIITLKTSYFPLYEVIFYG